MPVRIPAKRPQVGPDPLEDFWDNMVDAIMDVPIRILIGIIGIVPIFGQPIAEALGEWLLDTNETAVGTKNAVVGGLTGGSTVGADAEVLDAVVGFRESVLNGYNVVAFTSTTVNWPMPGGALEVFLNIFGPGENGQPGQGGSGNMAGGTRGRSGSHLVRAIDPTTVPALDISLGAPGGFTAVRVAATTPHTGALLAEIGPGLKGGLATTFAYAPSESKPGDGGNGGGANSDASTQTAGQPGGDTAVSVGGTGGASGTGGGTSGHGGDGISVPVGAATKCGGSGGGGGGGRRGTVIGQTVNGGDGGDGGFPGGGGGGGGAAAAGTFRNPGAGGIGGAPIAFVFWR
ncbi:hypothetical protein [Gordonia terrae]